MVSNIYKVLDAGEIKSTEYIKMKKPDYVIEFEKLVYLAKPIMDAYCHDRRDWLQNCAPVQFEAYEWFKQHKCEWATHYLHTTDMIKPKDYKGIAELMDVEPFKDCVMINISPNWKGDFSGHNLKKKTMIKGFCSVINSYLSETLGYEPRYTKYRYCLECGSDGKFLHAHIVAEINPRIHKSMMTHINKGNHAQQLKKYWEKSFGEINQGVWKGCLKGRYSVQRVLIKNEEIKVDKLAYLHEENKQEGHKNLRDLNLIFGEL